MSSDIKLSDESVVVEGSLGVNTTTVHRTVEVTGSEVHSGGTGAGFSFASRDGGAEFSESPQKGERWVWYASGGTAKLWSGKDLLTVHPDGKIEANISGNIAPFNIFGRSFLGRAWAVRCFAQDLVLSNIQKDEKEQWRPKYAEDKHQMSNFALSHMPGDTLVINRGSGYAGGVEIDGKVKVKDSLEVGGVDLLQQIVELKAAVAALTKAGGGDA